MYRNNCEQNNLTSHLPMFLSFHSDSQHIHLEDKIANLWIKYFMMAAPDQESIQQAPPDIRIFFNDFNIDGIMPSVIHKNLSKIQSNPVEILPSILNFDQTISAAYFHFLRYISSLISLQEEKYIQASNLSIPHIMRAFIILTYSLPEIITNEANKKQSNLKVNYFTVLECLPYFADYFLNLEKEYYFDSIILLDNFFHVFASHFPVFFKQIDPQSCFFPVAKMVHKLIEKINSNCLINSSSISPFAEFISDFCHYSLSFIFNEKDYSPLLMAYLFFLVKNSHLLPNMENSAYWATNSFLVYFLTMITYVDDQKTLEEYVIYSLQILSILYPLRDINECANPFHSNSDSEKLAKVIFDIIKVLLKSFKNNGNENMNSKTICNNSGSETYCNEIKDSFDIVEYDYSKCSDEIINYSKFDFSSNNNCILSNETLKSLKTIISTLFGKSTKLFSHFIKLFIEAEQKDHFLQRCTYLCYLLSSLDVEIIASNLEKNQVWSTLICFKTIKSKSFRINSPNLPFIEYQNILCKIIKMVLCFSINSYKSSLITEICETLHTKNIKVIHGIINYLRSLIIDEESFENVSYSLSIHTLFIDLIMNIDRNIKVEIKKSLLLPVITEQKIQELIKCHYEIFLFMKEFLPYKLNNVVIFSNKSKRIYFVYSYLFEKDHHIHSIMNTIIAQAYQKVKSTYLLIKSIDEIIKFKLHTKSEQYLFSILSSFVNLIIMAIHSNPNDVSKYIMLCDSLQILAKLPNHLLLYHAKVQSFEELKDDFILCDEAYNDIIVMIHFLIQLNKELAMLSKDAANSINTNPSINVIFNLDNIAKYVKLNKITYNALISFLIGVPENEVYDIRNSIIINYGVLNLLHDWSLNTCGKKKYYEKLLDDISKLSKSSLINQYQLYKCSILSKLLVYIINTPFNPESKAFDLFSTIGVSFFHKTDLKDALHAISHSELDCSTVLINLLSTVFDLNDENSPTSIFHISPRKKDQLKISNVFVELPFYISFKIMFERGYEQAKFLKVVSQKHTFILSINDRNVEVNIINNHNECNDINVSDISSFQIINSKWMKFGFRLNSKKLKILVDNKRIMTTQMPSKMEISKICLQFLESRCNIDDVKVVQKKDGFKAACFTAKLIRGNECLNTAGTSAIAIFNGISIPFSPKLIDSFISSGGPKIILPLFARIDKSPNPEEYFMALLALIHHLLRINEDIFLNINFFRMLNHLFVSIKSMKIFSKRCSNNLVAIFDTITHNDLKNEMINYIWLDFPLIFRFDGLIPSFYIDNFKVFHHIVTFSNITSSFYKNLHSIQPSIIELLIYSSQNHFDENDANLLLSYFYSSITENFSLILLQFVFHLIKSNNQYLQNTLRNYDYFDPFVKTFLSSSSIDLRISIIEIMIQICNTYQLSAESKLYQALLMIINHYNYSDVQKEDNNKIINILLSFSIQTNVPQANKSKNCTLINIDAITGFHYPQFIPLILCFIQTIPYTSKSFNTISIVYKALYEEISQKDTSFQHINQVLPHWYFWIFLLMTHESQNNMARWKKLIGSILIQNQQDFQDFVSSLTIYCSLTKQIFIILFSEIMNYFFEEINVLETKELTNIRKSLISGTIIFNTCQIILLQPTVLLDLQNNLSYLIIDYIKSINSAITNIQYLKNLDFSCLTSSDGKWKVTRLLMFVIFYITNHTSLLSFMGDSETVIGYYIPILLEKIMPTDYELYSSHLTSILKESNTDSTFIRMVHLQAISVFHNHKNLIPILFKIVKEKNIEVSNLSNDEILSNADLINLTVNETVSRSIKTFTKQFEDKTKKVAESFGIIETLKPYSPHLYIIENRDFMISGYQRKKHYDSKLWEDTLDEMKHDVTSIWNLPNISTHRKYSQYFNLHGEHIHTKRNKNFDNHLSASLARDESIEVPQQASFHDFEQVETKIKDSIAFFEIDCRLLTLSSLFIGKLFIDNMMSLIFEGKKICDPITGDTKDAQKFVTIKLSEIRYILWRRFRHIDNSIEIMGSRSHFFTFQDANERLRFLNELEKLQKTKINDSHNAQANVFINMYIQMKPSIEAFLSLNFTGRWKSGKMTNYEYLFWVNMFAGRSYCDLSQYPVYPWILCDYSSNVLDLNNPNSFRDLSLPIGCLNKKLLEELKILKQELVGSDIYCLYRLHYSAAAYVIFYLLRCEPFTSLHINLQNNRFDDPNRLFKSVEETWGHVTSNNYDFRELIPEFFTFPEFLLNNDNFDLGVTSETHEQVNHVNMPPWASSASHFIALHKLALESPYVSSNIDKWIDLIFGYLQNGSQSEAANNDFHPWSYSSSINNLTSSIEHIQMHAANFGITPEQLFKEKHPTRDIKLAKQISTSKSISLDIDHYQAINGDNVVLMKNTGQKYLLTIDTKGRIVQYKLDGNINNSHSVLNRKSMLTKDDTNNFESTTVFEKHYALMPCLGLSLISAPWMDKFSLFQMKKTTGSFSFKGEEKLKNIFISPKHSACISIIRTNSNYIATGTHDAAVKLFKIKINDRNDVDETTAEYRLFIGHSASIVDIAMSKCLDTIISIDESGLLLMYNISKERLIYSMILKQTPKRVFLSKLGFFILVTEIVGEESLMTTQIRLFDFSGRLHKYFEYSTGFICGDICTMQDSSEFFIATFTNKCLIMFRAYDLADVCKYTMLSEILTFSFDKYDMTIFLKLANHEVYKATINCE